eukprot:2670799-Ditylum_brightwellii.AAC.1
MPAEEEFDLSLNDDDNDFVQVDEKVDVSFDNDDDNFILAEEKIDLSFDDDDDNFLPPPKKVCTKGHPALLEKTCATKDHCGGICYAGILNGQPCQTLSDCTIGINDYGFCDTSSSSCDEVSVSFIPSNTPSVNPSVEPSVAASLMPSWVPSSTPSTQPTSLPSLEP